MSSSSLRRQKLRFLGGLILMSLAFLVRWYHFELMPFTFDQGRDMVALQQIASGDITLVGPTTGIEGVFLGPYYFYFLLPGFILSGGSPIGVALWLSFWVTLSVAMLVLIVWEVTRKEWLAWIAGFLAVITPGLIEEARVLWNPSLTTPTLLLSWLSLFYSRRNPRWLYLSAVTAGLALQTELAYVIFLGPLYVWWMWQYSPLRYRAYQWKQIFLAVMLVLISLLPQVLFELKHNFVMTTAITREIQSETTSVTLAQVWAERPEQIAQTLQQRLFALSPGSTFFFLILILSFVFLSTREKLNDAERFIAAAFALPLLGLLLHTGNGGAFYPYYIYPHTAVSFLVLLLAVARQRFVQIGILVLSLVTVASFWHLVHIIYSSTALQYSYQAQIQALAVADELAQTDEYALEVFVPNLRPVQYQYLYDYLKSRGALNATRFFRHEENEYVILYEPYSGDGSMVAFQEWQQRHQVMTRCEDPVQIGIITLARCTR